MKTYQKKYFPSDQNLTQKFIYWIILLSLILGIILTVVSAMEVCSYSCSLQQKYRLYGLTFESFGIAFFSLLIFCQLLSGTYPILRLLVAAFLALALGAEGMFLYAQKFIINRWCPVCLSIALVVVITFFASAIEQLKKNNKEQDQKGVKMKNIIYSSYTSLFILAGFLFAQLGFSQFNPLLANEESLKNEIAFGNLESPIEIYVFTDWKCPACRQVEPAIVETSSEMMSQAKLFFVDVIVHEASLNFLPYNLSFMVNIKPQYLKLRAALTALSVKTETPTLEDIQEIAKHLGVKYKAMNFSQVSMANHYFSHLTKEFEIQSTPTVVVVNTTSRKAKKLNGKEITHEAILKAITDVKKE